MTLLHLLRGSEIKVLRETILGALMPEFNEMENHNATFSSEDFERLFVSGHGITSK